MGRLTGVLMLLLSGCATTASFTNERSGAVTTLDALKGHVVVLNFWAEWCPPCMAELPVLAELVADAGPDVLLIPAYYRSRPMPGSKFHVWLANTPTFFRDRVCWADDSIRAEHELDRLPLTVIYGRDGVIVDRFVGSITNRTAEFAAAVARALMTSAPATK